MLSGTGSAENGVSGVLGFVGFFQNGLLMLIKDVLGIIRQDFQAWLRLALTPPLV